MFLFLIILPFISSCDNDGKAQETRIDFDNSLSGSFVDLNIDSNEDGETAVLAILEGNLGSLGKVTFQSLLELTPLVPEAIIVPCTTPNDGPGAEVDLVESDTVFRVENTGELIFAQGTEGHEE